MDAVTKKASTTRAFLCCNLSHCSPKIKETSYKTFVRPVIEYSAAAWDPHTQRNIDKLEMVQRSSARFVTGNFDRRASVTAMLQDLKWASLATRRRWSRLEMTFRIRFGLTDIDWSNYLVTSTSSNRGHPSRFLCHHCKSDVFKLLLPKNNTGLEQLGEWSCSLPNPQRLQNNVEGGVAVTTTSFIVFTRTMYILHFLELHVMFFTTYEPPKQCVYPCHHVGCTIMEGRKIAIRCDYLL